MQKFLDFLESSNLPKGYISSFLESGKKVYLKKKDVLLHQGEPCKYVAIVIKGEFLISRILSDGAEIILGFSEGNDMVTDYSAFLNESESQLNIQAISDSELLLYSQDQINVFFEYNMDTQRLGRKIAESLIIKWEAALISVYSETAEERYVKLLNQMPDLFQKLPLKYIASIIGVTPETVSRIRKRIVYADH